MYHCWTALLVLLLLLQGLESGSDKVVTKLQDYGPYDIVWKKFEKCNGPKKLQCNSLDIKLSPDFITTLVLNATRSFQITQCKISAFALTHNNKKQMVKYNIEKPCQHFALGPMLAKYTTKDCYLRMGVIHYKMNLTEATKMFLGKNFFYGDYSFKTIIFSQSCNFLCISSTNSFQMKV